MSKKDKYIKRYQDTGLILDASKTISRTKDEVQSLMKQPIEPKKEVRPKFSFNYAPNEQHQADILFLPHDEQHKYALIIVNVGYPRVCDAEPLLNKDAKSVLKAIKAIYKRKVLDIPKNITFDNGSEFKSVVKTFLESKGTNIIYAETDRHRKVALAENRNKTIGNAIFRLQYKEELKTGKPNTEWISKLPSIIHELNKHAMKQKTPKLTNKVLINKENKPFLLNSKVRLKLEAPREILTTGKKLHGKFRSADLKWSKKIYTITDIDFIRDMPPMYVLDGNRNTLYSRDQIQLIK